MNIMESPCKKCGIQCNDQQCSNINNCDAIKEYQCQAQKEKLYRTAIDTSDTIGYQVIY